MSRASLALLLVPVIVACHGSPSLVGNWATEQSGKSYSMKFDSGQHFAMTVFKTGHAEQGSILMSGSWSLSGDQLTINPNHLYIDAKGKEIPPAQKEALDKSMLVPETETITLSSDGKSLTTKGKAGDYHFTRS